MTTFEDIVKSADNDIFDALGDKGVLQDAAGARHILSCIVERDAEILDDFGKVIGRRDFVDIIVPRFTVPTRGWQLNYGGSVWYLDSLQASDGNVQTWSLRT